MSRKFFCDHLFSLAQMSQLMRAGVEPRAVCGRLAARFWTIPPSVVISFVVPFEWRLSARCELHSPNTELCAVEISREEAVCFEVSNV